MKDFAGVNHAGNYAKLTETIVAGQVLKLLSLEGRVYAQIIYSAFGVLRFERCDAADRLRPRVPRHR